MAEKLTPMMAQYKAIKEKYSDCMVLFRLGDFYEMFFEDAVEGSKILNITLTSRNKGNGIKSPMCGVPFHAIDNYISKLTRAGKKVAIADQVTEPDGRGIVEREVVRVVTPGTTFDDNLLDQKSNNYVVSLVQSYNGYGFSYCDVTTGDAFVTEFIDLMEIHQELARVNPSEIIMPQTLLDNPQVKSILNQFKDLSCFPFEIFRDPEDVLVENFGVKSISVFGLDDKKSALSSFAFLYEYLKETQKTELKHIEGVKFYTTSEFVPLNSSTIRNLEIFYSAVDGKKSGTLFSVIDKTKTAMGGRKLKTWMIHPLKSRDLIVERLSAVSKLKGNSTLLKDVREELHRILDIERLLARLSLGTGNARDLVAMKESLKIVPVVKRLVDGLGNSFIGSVVDDLVDMDVLVNFIETAINDESPATVREGRMIKDGYNKELDELRSISKEGKSFISDMQKREIERTGISSLKIKYNKVFGYYIEISKANLENVPEDYIRKQTLVNAERFITPELKEYEEKVLNSLDRIYELEYELFYEARMKVVEKITEIKRIANGISRLDVVCGFAELSLMENYCEPEILEESDGAGLIDIKAGRHPVLENLNLGRDFVPNDCFIDPEKNVLNLITGPNMGGKSVYIKQIALIVYLAHIGSHVSASSCRLGLVDQIFTRVGASDNLTAGESTFMVEMVEASVILHNATERSLVIFDELGRGTSTYDGLSIAWAICEYIHDRLKVKTLFATHYHELIGLCDKLSRAKNFSVAVSEKASKNEGSRAELVFLYKIIEGGTSKSYGIEVAKLAGLPKDLVMKARGVLDKLERDVFDVGKRISENQIDMFVDGEQVLSREHDSIQRESLESEALKELKKVDPDNLTPLEALKKLHDLKEKGLI